MTDDASGGSEAGSEEDDAKRWVLQDLGANDLPRLGEVEDLPGGGVRVRFRGGDTVEWSDLPRSTRPVVQGSLAWQAALERPDVLAKLTAEPGAVISLILKEARSPLVTGEVQAKLMALRIIGPAGTKGPGGYAVPSWEDVWRKGRPALLRHPHVVVDKSTYAWSDTAIEKATASTTTRAPVVRKAAAGPDVQRLLGQVMNARGNADRAQEARDRLRDLARADGLTPIQRAAGAATSALIGESIDWSALPTPEGLEGAVLDALMLLAAKQQAWGYLARLAADVDNPRLAAEAADQLAGASHAGAGDALAGAFEELVAQSTDGRLDADGLAPQLTRLARAAARPTPNALIDPALRLLAAVGAIAGSDAARHASAAALVDLAGGAAPAELAVVVVALEPATLDRALRAAALEPFETSPARVALLEAVAEADPDVLAQPAYWAGLHGDVLPTLCEGEHLGSLLCQADGAVAAAVTTPAIDEVLATGDLRGLLAMELWPVPLRSLVDPTAWARGVRRAGVAAGESSLLVRALASVEEDARAGVSGQVSPTAG